MRLAWVFLGVILFAGGSRADDDPCEFYRKTLPRLYELRCTGGKGQASAGEAYSSFADAFNINPATAPIEPSPYGLETIASYPSVTSLFPVVPTFSLIKGFHKIGTAVSTGGNDTFYGNDVYQRVFGQTTDVDLRNPEPAKGVLFNLNAGTSFGLPQLGSAKPALGVSLRYNHITNTLGFGAGLALSVGKFSAGLGLSREEVSNLLPTMNFISGILSYKLPWVEFEYTFLGSDGDPSGTTSSLGPIHVLTATVPIKRFLISGAVRRLNYLFIGSVTQFHAALQAQVSAHFSVGYLINYIPGTQSLAVQVFL